MKSSHSAALAVALAMPLLAFAQASTPSLRYQSAFADYKPYQDIPAGNWRALNDSARDAGRGSMASDMAMPPPAAASAPEPTSPKAAPMAPMKAHMDHQMHGGMK